MNEETRSEFGNFGLECVNDRQEFIADVWVISTYYYQMPFTMQMDFSLKRTGHWTTSEKNIGGGSEFRMF